MITVIDSIMGSGKTNWAINYINSHPFTRYLYISPYIKEDKRIQKRARGARFYVPPDDNEPKSQKVKRELGNGKSVATTHALFKEFDEEFIEIIRKGKYTLIMDEVIEVMDSIKLSQDDIEIILDSEAATTDEKGKMIWTDKYKGLSEEIGYGKLESLIKLNKIINVNDEALFWQFPPEIFDAFENIIIMTFMFEANIMYNYFKVNNISYVKKSIKDGQVVDYYTFDPSPYKDLIHIYEGKLNDNLENDKYTFSMSWYKYSKDKKPINLKIMKNNIYNWFFNITDAKSKDTLWTTFKNFLTSLKGKGYTKGFLSPGTRATNDYVDRTVLAYCINKYHNPWILKYFYNMGYPIDEELFALSDLIQWIWRSAIRQDPPQPIQIYIPSPRMRDLLYRWLNNEIRF